MVGTHTCVFTNVNATQTNGYLTYLSSPTGDMGKCSSNTDSYKCRSLKDQKLQLSKDNGRNIYDIPVSDL